MPKRGKKYQEVAQLVDQSKTYGAEEATELVRKLNFTKFDATVELHLRMNLDPRQADQQIRGVVPLPQGTGKPKRILVFAEGEAEHIAREAGADYVGSDEFVAKIQEGWFDFDVTLAVPQIMGKIGRLGRLLGTRGLMPSPKICPAQLTKSARGAWNTAWTRQPTSTCPSGRRASPASRFWTTSPP